MCFFCMYVYVSNMLECQSRPEEDIRSFATVVTDGCEPLGEF